VDYPAALGCNNATGTRLTDIMQHDGQSITQKEKQGKSKGPRKNKTHSKQDKNPIKQGKNPQQTRQESPTNMN
jgi:hypothetical protein